MNQHQSDLRSGDTIRDLFYQSPYLKRFTANRLTPFSNDKYSANKENISPLSGSATQWLSTTGGGVLLRSGGGATASTASGGNTILNTPNQNNFRGL